jgi:hypothetical protein
MLPTFLVARKPRFTGSTRNAGNPGKGGNPGAGTVFSGDVVASSVAATIARRRRRRWRVAAEIKGARRLGEEEHVLASATGGRYISRGLERAIIFWKVVEFPLTTHKFGCHECHFSQP